MRVKKSNKVIDSYKRLYLEYAPSLLRFAQKFTPDFCAEDIVHDVFLKFWEKQIYLLSEDELRPLLYASVRNSCIDYLRRLKLEQNFAEQRSIELQLEELHFFENADELFLQRDFMSSVLQRVNELSPRMQEIFHLSYVAGLKNPEIAEKLNISTRTVENQLYRILLHLKTHFKSHSEFLLFLTLFL